jgi:peptide chain release factor 2
MDLDTQMSDPAFWDDPEKARTISQEATQLKTEVEGHEELVRRAADLMDYLEMAMEDGDTSFTSDIEKQYKDILQEIEKREVRLLLSGEYDKCNAIITFHAGAGGTEAQDWCQMLIRMYTRWAERNGYHITVMDMQIGEEAGIKSATFTNRRRICLRVFEV